MGQTLSVMTGARRLSLRAIAIMALVVAASAATASRASAAQSGVWKVAPGQTLRLSNMDVSGCDTDVESIWVDGGQYAQLGSNSGHQCTDFPLHDFSYTPTDGRSHTVVLELYDSTKHCGWVSDGPNGVATSTAFSIDDGGGYCAIIPATLGHGNFNGSVKVSFAHVDRIYWDNANSDIISFANLNGKGHGGDLNTSPVTPSFPLGLAMDLSNGRIYWADQNGNTISSAKLNDTGGGRHLNTTGASTPDYPAGVATDPATGKIYWANNVSGVLSFAKLNNKGGGDDLSITGAPHDGPVGVAVDPAKGKIYWANANGSTISWAYLNGTGGGKLDTSGATVSSPQGLAIDPVTKKIYWANEADNTHPISYAKLNNTGGGGDLDVTGATADGAVGVAIDPQAGMLYWANLFGDTISYASVGGGGGGQLMTAGATAPDEPATPALLKAPLATARPEVSGGSVVGSKLSCSNGKWAPDLLESFLYQRPVSFSYSWSHNGSRIAGATTKAITASHAGTYSCTVTAINEAGGTKAKSASHTVS